MFMMMSAGHLALGRSTRHPRSNRSSPPTGANVHLQDAYFHRAPLLCAVINDNAPCVEFLLSKGSNIATRDVGGFGPLHLCGSPAVMQILLSHIQDTRFLEAKSSSGKSAIHSAVGKTAASEPITLLARAGADLDAMNVDGITTLLWSVDQDLLQLTELQLTEKLHSLGARVDCVDKWGQGILHITASKTNFKMMSLLRSLAIEGVNPEHEDIYGSSAVEYFKDRMEEPWLPGQRRPTQADVFCFYALITEIRDRNWERGLFLETRERLEEGGSLKNIKTWLGAQWQALREDEEYGDLIWDIEDEYYPEDYPCEDIDIDYDVGILFSQMPGNADGATEPLPPENEEDVEN